MSIWDSKRAIGIELELYSHYDIDDMYDYIDSKGLQDKFDVCHDGSLSDGGLEIRFLEKTPFCESQPLIDSLSRLSTDKSIHACFSTPSGSAAYNNNINSDIPLDPKLGLTGLHVHVDAGENYNPLDALRLMVAVEENASKFDKLAMREAHQWALRANNVHRITKDLRRLVNASIPGERGVFLTTAKYRTVNFKNLLLSKKSIEFRQGDATLICDPPALNKYLEYIMSTVTNSFSGLNTLRWGSLCVLKWENRAPLIQRPDTCSPTSKERTLGLYKQLPDGNIGNKIRDIKINI